MAGATTLGSLLAACGVKPADLPPKAPAVSVTEGMPAPTAETQSAQESPTTRIPSLSNLLAVVRNGEPEELARKALDVFGGMSTFVKPGADVIIKPNICIAYRNYELAATTNPWLVGALVKLCFEAGAGRVQGHGSTLRWDPKGRIHRIGHPGTGGSQWRADGGHIPHQVHRSRDPPGPGY